MAVNFSDPACVESTDRDVFGICDDPPPAETQAYLNFDDSSKWIAWVDNQNKKEVTFTAIDHCIKYYRPDGKIESSCDGMLQYDTTLVFVELKDRDGGRWLGKARDQLQITIDTYKKELGFNGLDRFYAHVANKQRPQFKAASTSLAEKFEDDTGFVLLVKDTITIE